MVAPQENDETERTGYRVAAMQQRGKRAGIRLLAAILGFGLGSPGFGSELSRQIDGQGTRSLRQIALEAALAVGDPPTLYWAIGIALFSILIVVSILPLFVRLEPGDSTSGTLWRVSLGRGFYGWMVGLSIVGLRWPLLARTLLNTDESHSIACAMKLAVDPVFWRGIDGTTGGPLLYYPLLLSRVFGLPIEYGSARAVGLLALIGSVLLLYGLIRRLLDEGIARIAVLPLIACWALSTSVHFVHYSSEQITVFVITLALYLLIRWWKDEPEPIWSLVSSGLVLGSLPFAKLQAVPIGLFLAASAIIMIVSRYRGSVREIRRRVLALVGAGFVVPLLVLIPALVTGVFRDFWQSYLVNNLGYGGRYQQLGEVGQPLLRKIWVVADRMFWTFDLAELVGPIMLFSLLVFVTALFMARATLRELLGPLSLAGGLLLVSGIAVAFPNTLFSHYFLFLAVPVTLFGAVWLGLAVEILRARYPGRRLTVALGVLVVMFLAVTVARPFDRRLHRQHPVFSNLAAIPKVDRSPVAEVVLQYANSGEPIAVWGWQPWRYVETGLHPATRDTQTQWQILDTPQRPYYLARYRADLLESLPPVFVDTVGYVEDPRSPWRPVFWNREEQGHEAFPEVGEVIEQNYLQVAEPGASRVYVERSRLAEVQRLSGKPPTD